MRCPSINAPVLCTTSAAVPMPRKPKARRIAETRGDLDNVVYCDRYTGEMRRLRARRGGVMRRIERVVHSRYDICDVFAVSTDPWRFLFELCWCRLSFLFSHLS